MTVQIQSPEQIEEAAEQYEEQGSHLENVAFQHADFDEAGSRRRAQAARAPPRDRRRDAPWRRHDVAAWRRIERDGVPKVGRNDPCPCGSGKKYKQCHGKLA